MINLRNKLIGLRALWPFDNRWQLIFERLFFPSAAVSVYRKGDVEFLIDHAAGDHNGTRLCIVSDIYTRFLPKMKLRESISVFDLGANGGGFPLMLLLNEKRLEQLVCVEMNPNTFRRLQYNVSRNIRGRHTLINGAICGEHRLFKLSLGRGDISDSIYQGSDPRQAGRSDYSIQGYTFDELFRAHFGSGTVDICKMDIEGAEYEVLVSPEHECLRACRYLIIELHAAAAAQLQRIEHALDEAGFALGDGGDGRIPGERLYENRRLN